jgi:hypothetical protein
MEQMISIGGKMSIVQIMGNIMRLSPTVAFTSVGEILRVYEDELRARLCNVPYKIQWSVALMCENNKTMTVSSGGRRYSPGFLHRGAGRLDDKIAEFDDVLYIMDMDFTFICV